MVAGVLIAILSAFLAATSSAAVPVRQLCLVCHPVHYVEHGGCIDCHRGNPSSDRKNIAHRMLIAGRYARFTLGETSQVLQGKRLIDQYACRRCHVIGGKGNRLSVSLDRSAARTPPEELASSILKPVRNMPDFGLEQNRADLLVNALLLAAASSRGIAPAVNPQVVHFDKAAGTGQDAFSMKCGPCHRALTDRLGALGRGDTGPNLSGLLSPFYPETFRERGPWTERDLGTWLKNPRLIKRGALMQPVPLAGREFRELADSLSVGPASEQ